MQRNIGESPFPKNVLLLSFPFSQKGKVQVEFPLLAVVLAIALFPCGLACCFALREKRCGHCGIVYL